MAWNFETKLDPSKFENSVDFEKWLSGLSGFPDVQNKFREQWNSYNTAQANDIILQGMNYKFPEAELGKRLNIFGQGMTAQQQQQMRAYQESFAGQTGGRMSSARGQSEIGGQAALARATGAAQIMTQAFTQEMQTRQNALNAYISKYGIDKNAALAQKQLDAQREAAEAQMWADTFGNLMLLPFLFSGGGDTANTNKTLFNFDSGGSKNYSGYV